MHPLLFIIFVKTIDKGTYSKLLKFADDEEVLRAVERLQDQNAFHSALDKMFKCSTGCLNVQKPGRFEFENVRSKHRGRL